MNSKDFYRYLNTVLSPAMKQIGFVKDKRSIPCWHTGTGERLLYLMVKTGKYPYQPYIGGDFSLYACLRDTDDPPPQAGDLDLDIFEYADETLKQRILAQNRAVYGKIAALDVSHLQNADAEYEILLSQRALTLPSLRFEAETDRPWIEVNKPLLYLDEADIAVWGGIVADVFAVTATGVRGGIIHNGR